MRLIEQPRRAIFLLILVLIVLSIYAQSQTVWNKIYIEDRPTMLFSSIIADDNGYKLTGGVSGTPINKSRAFFCSIDSAGLMSGYVVLVDSTNEQYGLFNNNLIRTADGRFAFTGYSYDSLPSLTFGISHEENDSIVFFKYYTAQTGAFQGYSLLQYGSDFYIAGVRTPYPNFNSNLLLMKIDSAGNRLWERMYDQYKIDYSKKIIKLNNGNILLGAVRSDLGQPVEHANTWLLELDTGGAIVRQWFDLNDSTYAAEGLLQTEDGGFLYGAQKKVTQTVNAVYKTATIIKMDSMFNKQWEFKDGDFSEVTGIFDLEEHPTGGYVCCGNKPFYNGDSTMLSGWVVKLAGDGTVVWSRTYAGIIAQFSYNYLTDIDVLPDGSLIAVGQCQKSGHTPPQMGWFLKLDSNGCEVESCLIDVQELDQKESLTVFPNPFHSEVYVSLKDPDNVILSIYNFLGQVVYLSKDKPFGSVAEKLELENLPVGNYLLKLNAGGKSFVKRLIKE